TWYKVEIMETLRRQRKGSDKALDIELPGRLLPLLPSESLLDEQGGVITFDGDTLIEELSSEGVAYFPNEEYLIVGYLDYGGKLIMRGSGRASVFHVKNSRLRPYGQMWRRLVGEMEEKYGNDLDRLRSSMH